MAERPVSSETTTPALFREHARLTSLLEKIPKKAQRGLMTYVDITLTSVDANKAFIALGTSVGLVFLYNRAKDTVDRLRCESYKDVVKCVKLHWGIDQQVAVGTASGHVYLFQIPTQGAATAARATSKQLQQFCLDLHQSPVTCVHWSSNGMKVFSGSESGKVVSTEVDFYEGQSKSTEVLKEHDPVVQLDYTKKTLLVSTTTRTLLCLTDNNNQVIQVGQKERKIQGHFGTCYAVGVAKADTYLYAARPSQRLWKADLSGTVNSTYIFKELLSAPHPEIQLLHCQTQSSVPWSEFQFQKLVMLGSGCVLTWSQCCLCLLDPSKNTIVGSQNRMGEVLDVAACTDEVFVVRHGCEYNLVRLGEQPEKNLLLSPVASPVPSPVNFSKQPRGASTVNRTGDEREAKNRSPFSFLQKSIFKKLHSGNDKELGVPVGVEMDAEPDKPVSGSDWGPERESVPRLLEFSAAAPGHSSERSGIVTPAPHSLSKKTKPHTQDQDASDLPPVITLGEAPSIQLYEEGVSDTSHKEWDRSNLDQSFSGTSAYTNSRDSSPKPVSASSSNLQDFGDEIVFPKAKPKKTKKKGKQGKSQTDVPEKFSDLSPESDSGGSKVSLVQEDEPRSKVNAEVAGQVKDTKLSGRELPLGSISVSQKQVKSGGSVEDEIKMPGKQAAGCDITSTGKGNVICKDKDSTAPNQNDVTAKGTDEVTNKGIHDMASKAASDTRNKGALVEVKKGTPDITEKDNDDVTDSGIHLSTNQYESPVTNVLSHLSDELTKQTKSVSHSSVKLKPDATTGIPVSKLGVSSSSSESATGKSSNVASVVKASDKDVSNLPAKSPRQIQDESDKLVQDQLQQGSLALNLRYGTGRPLTTEDIYDKYGSWNNQPLKDGGQPVEEISESTIQQTVIREEPEAESDLPEALPYTDMWAQLPSPGIIQSLSLSSGHVWMTDRDEHIHYSSLSGPGLSWNKISVSGKQVAVSPNGSILWRVHRNKAYAASKITAKNPEGTKWIEAVRDVAFIALDNTMCWCVKVNGEVKVQCELRRDRTTHKIIDVPCKFKLRQMVCLEGVVWAVTDECQLLVRSGVTDTKPYGTDWALQHSEKDGIAFWCVALGPNKVGWAMDVLKRVWFCMNVSREQPFGDQKWWQVSRSEFVVQDPTAVDKLKMFAGIFDLQRIVRELGTQQGGLIACEESGIWVCSQQEKDIQVCRSAVLGNHWQETHLLGMASSTCWKHLSAGNAHLPYGSVWAQQPNGELFAFPPHSFHFTKVDLPGVNTYFTCLSVSREAAWGLTADGKVFIRTGMGPHCPLGVGWLEQDLTQMGEAHIISISCGSQTVWAVDSEGHVFQRLGVRPASSYQLNPAWLPIPSNSPIFFTHVSTGPEDFMVWAVDSHKQVYARVGVTDQMPIGKEWVHVPGIQANELSVSQQNVWALALSGELYCRRGILKTCQVGDYWQKIPTDGTLVTVSAAADDDLWGISGEGKLFHRTTQLLPRHKRNAPGRQVSLSVGSEGEWEFL